MQHLAHFVTENDKAEIEAQMFYQDVDGQAARNKQARRGRCLLSLDKYNYTFFYILL
jgi:hypothetical protein